MSPTASKAVTEADELFHPEPYYDEHGRFIHYCHCRKWGAYGVGYFPRKGKLGRWYCYEHRPAKDSAAGAPAEEGA
jgi:hypothetical protein